MHDAFVLLLGLAAIFLLCFLVVMSGSNGNWKSRDTLGCTVLLFIAVAFFGLWSTFFGSSAWTSLAILVGVIGLIAWLVNGYVNMRNEKKK